MMSLYRRGGPRGFYWSRIMHKGNVVRQSLKVRNINEARRRESVLRNKITDGTLEKEQTPLLTFEITSGRFLNYLPARVKPETFRAYTNAIRRLNEFTKLAECPLDLVDTALIDEFTQHCLTKELAKATINLSLRTASRMFHLAVEWGLLTKVPKIRRLPGENQREAVISETDEARLIDASQHPTMKALIPFLIDTGLRIGEACALTGEDVREGSVRVRGGKTKLSKRTIPLTKRAGEVLQSLGSLSNPDSPVFTRHHGGRAISPVWATKHFVETRRVIGLPDGYVLHSTRHTFCTRLGKAGASAFELQRLAGHAGITISARYCHPDEEQLTRAIGRLNK